MLRLTLAVAASFLTISVLAIATQFALLRYVFHSGSGMDIEPLPPAYFLSYGLSRLVYAVLGGCMCAAIGKKHEAPTILGALMLGTAIGSVVINRNGEPLWYAALVPFAGAVTATISGYRWLGHVPEEKPKTSRAR